MVLTGSGGHFCSGLDLAEHKARSGEDTVYHSRNWHRVSDLIEYGRLPVISAMTGAVIGGGLEIAASTHVRIAEPSVRFQLPEGRRGIFVGGGATVRIGRLIGADRMREMMLTGRSYGAQEGWPSVLPIMWWRKVRRSARRWKSPCASPPMRRSRTI
ncbi:enoyl-CoA hydratase-related protein [Pannonibacter sp. Pt2-lr]